MVDIGRNVFIVSNRMRGRSKVKGSSKTISPATTNLCSERWVKGMSPLTRPEQVIFHKSRQKRMISSQHLSQKRR